MENRLGKHRTYRQQNADKLELYHSIKIMARVNFEIKKVLRIP